MIILFPYFKPLWRTVYSTLPEMLDLSTGVVFSNTVNMVLVRDRGCIQSVHEEQKSTYVLTHVHTYVHKYVRKYVHTCV